jgi:hypothetical protein
MSSKGDRSRAGDPFALAGRRQGVTAVVPAPQLMFANEPVERLAGPRHRFAAAF